MADGQSDGRLPNEYICPYYTDSGTFSTSKQGNRLRLFELQSVSADAMRIVFDSMPDSFANKIKEYCNLFPNSKRTNDLLSDLRKGTKSTSKNLDISLMYSIIRNLWEGDIPQNGWGKDPMGNHKETADDIERIRHYRNFICHSDDSGIDTNVFNFSCLDLSRGCNYENCEFMAPEFKSSTLLPYIFEKNEMHDYDAYDALRKKVSNSGEI